MTSLLDHFIAEARDYLESASAVLLKLERAPADATLINEVFRAVHTLKGSSGLFEIPGLTRLVHAAEDLLVAVRSNQCALDSPMVDQLLDVIDQLTRWTADLEKTGRLPSDADSISATLSRALRARFPAADGRTDPASSACGAGLAKNGQAGIGAASAAAAPVELLAAFSQEERLLAFSESVGARLPLLAIAYTPDEDCFYRAEDPLNLLLQLSGLKALVISSRPVPDAWGESDPFRCGLTFQALVVQPRDEIEALFRYVIEQIAVYSVGAQAALRGSDGSGKPAETMGAPKDALGADQAAVVTDIESAVTRHDTPPSTAVRILTEQIRVVMIPGQPQERALRLASVGSTVINVLASLGQAPREGELESCIAEAEQGQTDRLVHVIGILIKRVEGAEARTAVVASVVMPVGEARVADARPVARVLKVEQGKVDLLMNLIGELVVAKNGLPFLARRAEETYGSRLMGREIKDQFAVIDRLAQEMQRAIMDVRMLPVSEVFDRFPRLVRDLSRKLDKRIALKIVGEETAADKTVIEALGDPLIHLVRNSIDHGIEDADRRAALGKPETATIQLKAYQEGDQVVIEVSDDGKGIDPAVIRAKAVEKGLISQDKADGLSDQDAIDLIFLPGFSTTETVSDLSGRGVGMDVVRSAIDRINGRVVLSSRRNEGTLTRLSLPLSMAVTRVMMVEVGESLFGIPMDGVAEMVRVPKAAIRRIKHSESFVLRNSLVPLVRMQSLLDLPPEAVTGERAAADEEAVLVAKVGGATVGLGVDRFREGIDVILKPLEGVLAGVKGYAGSALLGDGRVLLVLNLKELV